MSLRTTLRSLIITWAALAWAQPALGFILSSADPDPWLSTASGPRPGNGAPATITWSIVPDGTSVTRDTGLGSAPSNLIAFMNTNFNGNPAETNLMLQPWFSLFEDSFRRWEELSGVDYVYQSQDDGQLHPSANGVLGVRGDIRIGGINVDGASGTLAYTWLPPSSEMVIDTGDTAFFTNTTNGHVNFRNTLMHEIGHGFGLLHVNSTSNLLLEPVINTSFDGPQLDEVRGIQFFFGDSNEKSNGGLGNGSHTLASDLGAIAEGNTAGIGTAADLPGQAISANATDFVSIANLTDDDYFSFSVSQPSLLNATLIPRGGMFTQASEGLTPTPFDANARNNLSLTLFDTNGTTPLATADANPAGLAESFSALALPAAGTYYVRISGTDDTVQLYDLDLTLAPSATGDYNNDGFVNAADYTIWRNSVGQLVSIGTGADGSGPLGLPDGMIDQFDYDFWKANYGQPVDSGAINVADSNLRNGAIVPEPTSFVLLLVGLFLPVIATRCHN